MASRVLISGGGTGGHVFPAIAIANALKAIDSAIEVFFVGAEGRLEMQKVPEAGYEIEGLWISGFQRQAMWKNISLPFKVLSSLWKAGGIINKFKPDVVVGVGGYASGPTMYMADKKGIPVLVQEQNSFAGITNKLMAQKAKRFCVAYEGMEKFFPKERVIITGNPVRENIAQMKATRSEGIKHFGLEEKKPTILSIGGSLGARTINDSLLEKVDMLGNGIQLIWQTGKVYYDTIAGLVPERENVKIMPFIKEMELAYAAADIIISRAGALSIAELACVGKPVILVPSPNVSEDHQTKNALALVEKQAAILIKDSFAQTELVPTAIRLLNDDAESDELAKNIKGMGIPNAAERIANEVLQLAKK